MSSRFTFVRAARARATVATAAVVTAALLAPTQASATAPVGAASDVIDVTGTVQVLAGEGGERDRYSLLLPSGRTLELAEGFTAEPLSEFAGSVEVPGTGDGRTLTGSTRASALQRAAASGARLEVVDARVVAPGPAPGPTAHTTYVAKVTNFGPIALTDAQILANVDASQAYWIRESGGQIPAWTRTPVVAAVASTASSFAAGCGLGAGGADFAAVTQSVGSQAFPGIDFSGKSPHHLVVVVPHNCGADQASGRANLGTSFASGGPMIIDARPQPQPTIDHELGHNLGLQHANTTIEYGDNYEVMGAGPDQFRSPVLGTVYRWEQGIIAPGEVVDGTAGGTWTLAPRSSTTGLRSVVVIDPDNGRRTFVDYRNAAAGDAGTCYAASCDLAASYGQSYTPGITVQRENDVSGAVLLKPAASNDGALQGGEGWSNTSGTLKVFGNGAAVSVTRAAAPNGTVAGGTISVVAPMALRDATASVSGFVPAPAGYRYQWTFNGQAIAGAEERTFRPTTAMAGGALAVVVTAYAPGFNPVSRTSVPQTVSPALWYALPTRKYPEITGTPRVGETLSAVGIDWVNYYSERPADLAPVYQWSRSGTPIVGATAATYRLTSKDLGKAIQVTEYPRAAGYSTNDFARSGSTAKVAMGRLVTSRPTIGGKAKVGKRVVAKAKGWTNATAFRYQWYVGKRAVRGATKKKLVVTRSMRGKKLVVKVTGKKAGYQKATVRSRPKKVR